jgi:hypothetical protein
MTSELSDSNVVPELKELKLSVYEARTGLPGWSSALFSGPYHFEKVHADTGEIMSRKISVMMPDRKKNCEFFINS